MGIDVSSESSIQGSRKEILESRVRKSHRGCQSNLFQAANAAL